MTDSTNLDRTSYQFIASFDVNFGGLALTEISQAAEPIRAQKELSPGILLVESDQTFAELAHLWRENPPVFVRHICPVQATVQLTGNSDDLASIEQAALDIGTPALQPDVRFSVQTRILADTGFKPYDVNTRISEALVQATSASVDVRNPELVVSVVCASTPDRDGASAYLAVSDVEDNLSDWAGGMRRFARESGQVSRSEFKLLEALEVFEIELQPRGVALDLGAAPGGWTRVLRQRELYVTAVDPGDLHPSVQADSGVRHLKLSAEEYLTQGPDRYDVIVNDMRMDARDSARLMVRYADHLYADGLTIMTLKLPERKRRSVIDHSLAILNQTYEVLGMKQLFHNRSEITLYLARRKTTGGEQDAFAEADAPETG